MASGRTTQRSGRTWQLVSAAVRRAEPSIRGLLDGRFTGDLRDLAVGRADAAARGLRSLLRLRSDFALPSLDDAVAAIESEFAASGTDEDCECLDYVLHQRAGSSGLIFANSPFPRDHDASGLRADRMTVSGEGMTIDDFCEHHLSRAARLGKAHVLALRLYTTAAFKSIVNPMRCVDLSHSWSESPHALPVTVYFLTEAISRLRSVDRQVSGPLDLWRGLANMSRALPADFERLGGTEKAPMSTTTSLDVAVRYSASRSPLLLRLRTPNFMQRGASIAFLSAFPVEEEVLFPPLTYMQVRRIDEVEVGQVRCVVIEVVPVIGAA